MLFADLGDDSIGSGTASVAPAATDAEREYLKARIRMVPTEAPQFKEA